MAHGVEKASIDEVNEYSQYLTHSVVSGDEIVCFCFNKEDAQKIMYALNRKKVAA